MLPKAVRERLKLLPGCKVEGAIDEHGRLVLVPAFHEPEEILKNGPVAIRRMSVGEMAKAIGRAVRR